MRFLKCLSLIVLATILLPIGPANAGMMFGKDQKVKFIQDIPLKGPNDETLFLGHMVETRFFIAGIYVKDSGYALGVKGNGNSDFYYPLPEGEKLIILQQENLIPNPLPAYTLSTFDYAIGYSLWLIIGFSILWVGIKVGIKRIFKRN